MNTISEHTATERKLVPKGTHPGRCISIVDLGTGPETYKGETNIRRTINITWELPKQSIEIDGELKPMRLSKKFTASLDPKAVLRKFLDSWIAPTAEQLKSFNPETLLGKECLVTVGHYTNGRGEQAAGVNGVSSLPEGMEVPATGTELMAFDPSKPGINWDKLLDWQKERVQQSQEYKAGAKSINTIDETTDAPF